MDWGFLDIFKKAEFNSLMLSIAVSGGFMYFSHIDSIIFGLFSIASVYCLIRFVVYCYINIASHIDTKRYEAQQKRDKENKEKEYEEKRRIEITRMFYGLSDSNKFVLASLLLKGDKDSYNYNVLHYPKYGNDSVNISTARHISMINRTSYGSGDYCISTQDYTDTMTVTIDPILYGLIENYIKKEQSKNK